MYSNLPDAAEHAPKSDRYILAILTGTGAGGFPEASAMYHVATRDMIRLDFENNIGAFDDDEVYMCLDRAIDRFLSLRLTA